MQEHWNIDCEQSLAVPQKSVEQSLADSLSTSPLKFCVFWTEQDSEEQKETARSLARTRRWKHKRKQHEVLQSRAGDSLLAEVSHGELYFLILLARCERVPLLAGNSRQHKMRKLSKLY